MKTVTGTLPAAAMSPAGIAAVSWPAPTNVVVRSEPFQRTTEPSTKPDPLTVRVKSGSPAITEVGESVVIAGAGLSTGSTRYTAPPRSQT